MANWFLGRALAEEAEAENAAWSFLGEGAAFWVTVAVLLVLGVAVYLITRKKSSKKSFWTAKTMAVGAMCMALSSVLSLIKLWSMLEKADRKERKLFAADLMPLQAQRQKMQSPW